MKEQIFILLIRYGTTHICHAITLYLMHRPKYGKLKSAFVLGSVCLVSMFSAVFLALDDIGIKNSSLLVFGSMFLFGVAVVLISAGGIKRSLFVFAVYANFFMIIALISQMITDLFFGGSDIAMAGFRTLFFVVYIVLMLCFLKPAFIRATQSIQTGWGKLAVFAVAFLIGISLTELLTVSYITQPEVNAVICFALSTVTIIAYYVLFKVILYMREESDNIRMQAQQAYLQTELIEERNYVNAARQFRHDMRHHNSVLSEYLDNGDYEEAKEYLNGYDKVLADSKMPQFCENTVCNALLGITARRCKAAGTTFDAEVEMPKDLAMTATDVGTLFGNLFENACEACEKCENAFMRISTEIKDGLLYLEMKNSVHGTVVFENGLPKTTKRGGGIGLQSIMGVLDKYGGMLRCKQEMDIFISQITLPL